MNSHFDQIKVSVIIPTFNRADFLKIAIESVLKQDCKDFEIIITNDNSEDNTQEVVKEFSNKRIRYIRHKENMGVSAARNSAIKASKGEYIAFLDDDDEWLPEKLKIQLKKIEKSSEKICGVYSNFFIVKNSEKKSAIINPRIINKRGNLFEQFALGNPIQTSTVLIRRKCLEKVGLFDESISYMEDRDLWIRLSIKWDFEFIDEPLIKVHLHKKTRLSESLEGQTAGREKLLAKHNNLFRKYKKAWSKLHLLQGAQYCQLKDMKKGRKHILKGIKVNPFNVKAYFYFIFTIFGTETYTILIKSLKFCKSSCKLQ